MLSVLFICACGGARRDGAADSKSRADHPTTIQAEATATGAFAGGPKDFSGELATSLAPQDDEASVARAGAWPLGGWHVSIEGNGPARPRTEMATTSRSPRAGEDNHTSTGSIAPHVETDAEGIVAAGEDDTSGIAAITVTGTPVYRVPADETIVSINTATNTPTPTRTLTPTATRTPSPTPTRTPTPAPGSAPMVGGCQVLPSNNAWNTDISGYPVHPNSANFIASINAGGRTKLHPDWGGNGAYGIPYIVVPPTQPMVSITWTAYGDESDPGPYPIPLNAPIEGGPSSDGDRHVLAVRQGECVLYELYRAFPGSSSWEADSGAKWPLNSNATRPLGWTSADAAGLPILPGLVRYDEVAAGQINHALRFTVWRSQRGYILPATHFASSYTDLNLPPMGLRLRMKASFDISGYTGQSRVVLEALKKYGMINADNGSSWFITGAADPRWDDEDLSQLKNVPSSAFEVVYTGEVLN